MRRLRPEKLILIRNDRVKTFLIRHIIKINFVNFLCDLLNKNFTSGSLPPSDSFKTWILTIILSVHPDHRHHLKEDFRLGVDEFAAAAIPASSFQVEAVDVDSLSRGLGDVILHPPGHLIAQHHAVQRPALVGPSDLLKVQGKARQVKARQMYLYITMLYRHTQITFNLI